MLSSGKHILRLLNRRSRNGQSILIMAFAFMALIAFVGIAVDVALLFVRYSSLTRAVDAAAIAAAGQIREGTDYLTLQAVAQQFVKLQGNVNPDTVRVETCETEVYDYTQQWIKDNTPPGGPAPAPPPASDVLQALINPPAPKHPSELCKKDPQKLVRVTAQLNSPTTFLALLGWPSVLLEASAVSQTAVLDVALVIDTSWSQAYDTYYAQTTDPAIHEVNYPVPASANNNEVPLRDFTEFTTPLHLTAYDPANVGMEGINTVTNQPAIRPECAENRSGIVSGGYAANYGWAGCCNDPSTQGNPTDNSDPNRQITGGPDPGYANLPNGDPYLLNPPPSDYDPDWYIYDAPNLAEAQIQATGTNSYTTQPSARVLSGKPDGNYSDLLCRPFKDVRDAARRFIKRLDFVRGDRLVLVTFGADAKQIYPRNQSIPVITDKKTAIRTLNEKIGVEVNPSGLQYKCITDGVTTPNNWTNWRQVNNYWKVSQCRDTNMGGGIRAGRAALTNPDWIRRDSVWVMVLLSDGYPNRTPSYYDINSEYSIPGPEQDWLTVPAADRPTATGDLPPNLVDNIAVADIADYCGSPFTLTDPADPTSVWMRDPAKLKTLGTRPQLCVPPYWGGTDPNTGYENKPWGNYTTDSNGNDLAIWSFGFCPWYTFCNPDPNAKDLTSTSGPGFSNPSLPQCTVVDSPPMWYSSDPRNYVNGVLKVFNKTTSVPFCIDGNPDTRHFCSDADGVINSSGAYCDEQYDPDDYARDQADFAGLINYTDRTKGSFIAMFSIFFAHKMGTSDYVNDNILGIKFLRYMADAGDNGVIDNRLQQWYRYQHETQVNSPNRLNSPWVDWVNKLQIPDIPPSDRTDIFNIPDVIDATQPQKDPCAAYDYREQGLPYPQPGGATYEDLAKHDCGQFWYANNITKVNDAFTEIAGRLFTRLSR